MATQGYKSQLKGQNGLDFRAYWNTLDEQASNNIRVFLRGDVFTLHGKNTKLVQEILHIENIRRTNSDMNTTGLEWSMVNLVQLRMLLRELVIVRGFKCEIYESCDGSWEPLYGSPGNLSCIEYYVFSYNVSDSVSTCKILALNLSGSTDALSIGLAVVDAETNTASLCKFTDDHRCTNLESVLVQIQVKELLVIDRNLQPNVSEAARRCGVTISQVKAKIFDIPNPDEIKRIFAKGSADVAEDMSRCVAACVRYLNLGGQLNLNVSSLDMSRFARLDSSIFVNLHLDSCSNEPSVAALLSQGCSTSQGVRLIRKFITQPLVMKSEILERQAVVEFLVNNSVIRSTLAETELKKMPDICRVNMSLAKLCQSERVTARAALTELSRANLACKLVPNIMAIFASSDNYSINDTIVKPLTILDGKIQKLIMLLDMHIDPDHRTRLKRGIDDKLDAIADEIDEIIERINELSCDASQEIGVDRGEVKLDELSDGYVFRTANRNEKMVSKKFDVVSIKRVGVLFTSTKLRNLNENYQIALKEYNEQSKTIVKKMLEIVVGYAKYLTLLGELTGYIDAMVGISLAAVNSSEPWIKPEFSEDYEINITQLRHPLLENNIEFVPNDIVLTSEKRMMILTGPNMGGKSTYLRSVAVAVILAQIGSFIPAESATLSIHDTIIARIGAIDNLQRGVSTFLHEMSECESVFRNATEKSFVIIDELGRGTSTWDGFGLAWAIADSLVSKVKCLAMFATHYHEMASLTSKNSAAFNMHTSVHLETNKVIHLYQVEEGASSKSYGIEIAKLAGFPEAVLKRSRERALEEEFTEEITGPADFTTRKEATECLTKILKLAKMNSSNLKEISAEVINMAKQSGNSIIAAAIRN